MSVIVTDTGFNADSFTGAVVDLPSDTKPDALAALVAGAELVRIEFPAFSDGRGFTLARILRAEGFTGRLRAKGHVIADQYAMARRSGFDEVEISDDLAARQPQDQWLARADWKAFDYHARLQG
ncbi:DUF934 domain-containing protein [Albirhodobacter sp. R86504]|uniref:DUF934 domain-containing protein n=1 Tax=Albirhodobacter sp. R86504 TaxID=3093848 RepID=UPI00366DD3C7